MDAYKKAGVDINAGYQLVNQIKNLTQNNTLGSFGGLFPLDIESYQNPVLVAGTDGVGTKLLVAIQAQQNTQVGIDLVAMCVNDVLAQGAKPLFFLDYIGTGHLDTMQAKDILTGVVAGVKQSGAVLLGGETAEMPDMYHDQHYDLAGFAVGIADKAQLLTADNTKAGDVLIGLASNGLHSNGFSLVRDILFKQHNYNLTEILPGYKHDLQTELLKPTRIYVESVYPLIQQNKIHAIAHITGGGLIENVGRILTEKLDAEINVDSWSLPQIMQSLQTLGKLTFADMTKTFNLGIGMVLAVEPQNADFVIKTLTEAGEKAYQIGEIVSGTQQVILKGELQ